MATVALHSTAGKWIMGSTILASSMAFIDGTALNVVLPALQKNFNANGAQLFWILNAYLLILAALMLIGGSLGDQLGRKKVFMAGIFIFIAGSTACGLSANILLLIVFRMVQGVGGALMIPGSLSLISSSIHENERGKAIGTWSAFTTVVTVGGPLLGGALADAGLWRYIFFINVPIGLVALVILWRRVAETQEGAADHQLDYPGALAIASGLAFLTYGFLSIPALGMGHWQVYTSLGLGVILLIAFVWIESKRKHPMMPLRLFSNQTFCGANLLTFFLYAGLGAGLLFLSLNLVQVQGYSQLQSGLAFLPFTLLMICLARIAGRLSDTYGPRWLLIVGPATAGTGLLLLSLVKQTNGPADYWMTFFPGVVVFGLGISFTVAPLTTAVMGSVTDHLSGTASGVNNALTRLANVFANAILGALAVLFFAGALQHQLTDMPITTLEKQKAMAQATNLGNATVSPSLTAGNQAKMEKAFHLSFIAAYANIMRISAALGFLGALMTVLFIRKKAVKTTPDKD